MPKREITYKKIYKALPYIAIAILLIIYQLAIRKSITAFSAVKELSAKAVELETAPEKIMELRKQIDIFDNLIGDSSSDSSETRQKILGFTGEFCSKNNTLLTNFSYPNISDKKSYQLETNCLTVEGRFTSLVEYIYNMENIWKPGKVVSVRFYTQKNLLTKEQKLYANVYIQKVKKKS